ncbi:hypothetical protein EHS25_007204 [Saitozyma podzolica]|uniref:Major facilitator superfamily (MFS) profile domain-containing protein n=1 Tax=Saitozyma podzolica TaxID=1890683 RepID=A0A427XN71_9TREE|nr:hypothetical protein EHS25_007204 [Saitozyma podzolica]
MFGDFLFYGAKLFASTFIEAIDPASSSSVMTTWLWNLLNFHGRKRMQIIGFLAVGILYLLPAIWYTQLSSRAHIHGFQAIYFLSSFFQQFGPNCTTFLVAAEIYPISVRATAHGLSAASGKLGALMPAIMYNYASTRTGIVCWFGVAGWIVTWIFIPDTTGLDLREQERYQHYVLQGHESY